MNVVEEVPESIEIDSEKIGNAFESEIAMGPIRSKSLSLFRISSSLKNFFKKMLLKIYKLVESNTLKMTLSKKIS